MRISRSQLEDQISKIVRAAAQAGGILEGDQTRIEIAVSRFVRKNFHLRHLGSWEPAVEDLATRIEVTISRFSSSILVRPELMKALCTQLAEWINAHFQKVPGRYWKGLGRGFGKKNRKQ